MFPPSIGRAMVGNLVEKLQLECRYSAKLEVPALQLRPPNPTPIPTLPNHACVHHVSTGIALSCAILLLFYSDNVKHRYGCRHTSPSTTQAQQPRGKPRRHPPDHVLPTNASTANILRLSARFPDRRISTIIISSSKPAPRATNN